MQLLHVQLTTQKAGRVLRSALICEKDIGNAAFKTSLQKYSPAAVGLRPIITTNYFNPSPLDGAATACYKYLLS